MAACGFFVDLNIRDNKASADFKQVITESWKTKFQLVPPDMHQRNKAKQMIRHFKNHFLSILAGVDSTFPPYLWDLLLPQAKMSVNLLRQATINLKISVWGYFNGPFDFNKAPLATVSCRVLIHAKPAACKLWDYRAKPRLGIPIFGSNFWDPHWKQNSDSVSNFGDSGRIFFRYTLLKSHQVGIPISKFGILKFLLCRNSVHLILYQKTIALPALLVKQVDVMLVGLNMSRCDVGRQNNHAAILTSTQNK